MRPKKKKHTAPRPRAPGAGNQRKPETTGAHNEREKKTKKKQKKPSNERQRRKSRDTEGGGGQQPAGSIQRPGGKHKTGESARGAEKREANKTNNTQRQGRGHPGSETRESKRQSGRTKREAEKKTTGRGGEERKTKRQGRRHPGPETKESKRQRGRAEYEKKKGGGGEGEGKQRTKEGATPARRGRAKQKDRGKGEAHQNAPGRPARPTGPGRTSTRTHTRDPGVASSDQQVEVSASTRNSPGAPAESPVERRTLRETGRVSDRVHTHQPPQRTQPKTDAGGTRQGQPHRGAPKG